jgi:SOS-response transcriptional repressor LexA
MKTQGYSLNKNTEWVSLDDYVSSGDKDSMLYVRIKGTSFSDFGIYGGDLVVVSKNQPPTAADIVLMTDGKTHFLKRFSEVSFCKFPLRMVARNGKPVKNSQNSNYQKIGVVTHILKTVGGAK